MLFALLDAGGIVVSIATCSAQIKCDLRYPDSSHALLSPGHKAELIILVLMDMALFGGRLSNHVEEASEEC
jgi:hypothetical protein